MPESIYIHIPFCKTKCPYCDFASWANKENQIDRYFDSLILEIQSKCEAYRSYKIGESSVLQFSGSPPPPLSPYPFAPPSPISSIFIGGGTPSIIAPEFYEKMFNVLKEHFEISKDCEITLELNPGTANSEFLKGYNNLGINRISIGAQSFDEKILEILGRKHSIEETIEAIEKTKEAGFSNFNLDFIFSVPGMNRDLWRESIYKALEFNPKHISAYSLIIEPNTPFEQIYKDKNKLPSDDLASEFYLELCSILKKSGFIHYEVSNFAKPGFESKHNFNYWLGKEYFAFGVGAHRYLNGMRSANSRDLETYISNPNIETIVDYKIDYNFEKIMLNSRLNSGLDIELIQKITTKDDKHIKNMLNQLSNEGFIELSQDKIHLTDKGMFLNNEILLKLI